MDHLSSPANPAWGIDPSVPLYTFATCDTYGIDPRICLNDVVRAQIRANLSVTSPGIDKHRAHELLQMCSFFGVLEAMTGEPMPTHLFMKDSWTRTASEHPYSLYARGEIDSPWHYVERGETLILDTSILATKIPDWMDRTMQSETSAEEKCWHLQDMSELLISMSNMYQSFFVAANHPLNVTNNSLMENVSDTYYPGYPEPHFTLSVALLYDYLFQVIAIVSDSLPTSCAQSIEFTRRPGFMEPTELLQNILRYNGWCEAEIRMLLAFSKGDVTTLRFLSLLDHPHPEKNHSSCLANKCMAYQVQPDRYRTKHTTDGCQCAFVYADQTQLAKILRDPSKPVPLILPTDPSENTSKPRWLQALLACFASLAIAFFSQAIWRGPSTRIPVIVVGFLGTISALLLFRVLRNPDTKLYVALEPSRGLHRNTLTEYVAISHIWSDGLGNNEENAIPSCQFRRICRLVSEANNGTPIAFWLDTLAFPLSPEDAYDLALQRMRESYEEAKITLVIDQYLYTFQPLSCPSIDRFEELIGRIVVAPWNRRLWTYQEAHLTKRGRLVFQFLDTLVSDADILDWCKLEWNMNTRSVLRKYQMGFVCRAFNNIRDRDWDSNRPRWKELIRAKEALAFRETSQAADEGLCLGNIIGVDPKPLIVAKSREERMLEFWKLVGENQHQNYHASILFWAGEKLDVEGYRWAPLTLMDKHGIDQPTGFLDYRTVSLSARGLQVRIDSLIVNVSSRNDIFRDTGSQRYGFCIQMYEDSFEHAQYRSIGRFMFMPVFESARDEQKKALAEIMKQETVELVILIAHGSQLYRELSFAVQVATRSINNSEQLSLQGRGGLARLDREAFWVTQEVMRKCASTGENLISGIFSRDHIWHVS